MEAYERRMSALRAGEYVPPADDSYDPNADLRALESSHRRRAVERETYMSKEQLQELRRVQNERIEVSLVAYIALLCLVPRSLMGYLLYNWCVGTTV